MAATRNFEHSFRGGRKFTTAQDVWFQLLGYTTEMDELMAAADLFVGKPGGLTTSEALAKGLPMVVINPIPGQEERNSDHLLEEGVALRCNNLPALAYKINRLIDEPGKLTLMRGNAMALAKPQAAFTIIETLDRLRLQLPPAPASDSPKGRRTQACQTSALVINSQRHAQHRDGQARRHERLARGAMIERATIEHRTLELRDLPPGTLDRAPGSPSGCLPARARCDRFAEGTKPRSRDRTHGRLFSPGRPAMLVARWSTVLGIAPARPLPDFAW